MRISFLMLPLFLTLGTFSGALAQDTLTYAYDSVKVKKGSYFILDEDIIKVEKDTVFVFVDSLTVKIGNTDDETFYRELGKKASKRKWSQQLYNFLIIEPGAEQRSPNRNDIFIATRKINRYRNKVIDELHYKQLMLFGPSVDDTTRTPRLVFEKIGNKLHTTTREKVIESNLLLQEGERLNPERIQDAERILRDLPFIKDVRILPIDSLSRGDSVTLQVLTQDVFAYSFGMDFYGANGGALDLTYNNFLGLGHQLTTQVSLNRKFQEQQFGYGLTYRVPNIQRSFIQSEANFIRNYEYRLTNVSFGRDFISPNIEYAGGLDIGQEFRQQRFYVPGSENDVDTLQSTHSYQDLWLGKSFPVNFGDEEFRDRSRWIISGRYYRKRFSERPEVTENHNQDFQHAQLIIGSFSFSTRHYFRDRLVYSYGRTEDIPYGQKFTFSGGLEHNEFSNRSFASLNLSMARFLPDLGYIHAELLLESFYRNGKGEQGIIRPGINYISNLTRWRRFRTRHFLTLEFTRGINRFNNEFLTINRENGIRGFRSDRLLGNQRLNLNYELVAFSPADIVGFRLAPYFFYDASILALGNNAIYKGQYFHAFGLGCRLRNDNLTFNTLEIRLGFYPNPPADMGTMGFVVAEQLRLPFKDFAVTAPGVTPFR